eukprot:TRINITY_DN2176_c1_g3_i1.p1 TRINITY_DN2176_c1_g3~~TRINITY_DN2176_c1_g3_i1.p1  ORF type:complete len:252 (+),score=15.44 TRINITY_DN2176_c1_g3_i1:391-1146(+)
MAMKEASGMLAVSFLTDGTDQRVSNDPSDERNLEGLAIEMARSVLVVTSNSGPSTPRGTAGAFHKNGPLPPQGSRRRANTPPPMGETYGGECIPTKSFAQAEGVTLQVALRSASVFFGYSPADVTGAFWEITTSINNTIGMVPRPRASTQYIKYLGSFTMFEECRLAAEAIECYSFTWHTPQCPRQQWRLQGYALLQPNHNPHSSGVILEQYDPPACQGTITARLMVTTFQPSQIHGSFAAFHDSILSELG